MSDLALFELDAPAWVPVFHPSLPRDVPATALTKDEWRGWQKMLRCRYCGELLAKLTRASSCGGGDVHGSYDLCDDCAALDGCRPWLHEPVVERRKESNFAVESVAHCSCGWFILDRRADPRTPDDVLDAIADHVQLTHSSRWGFAHNSREHDRLVAVQGKRRAKYLRAVAS